MKKWAMIKKYLNWGEKNTASYIPTTLTVLVLVGTKFREY